ncbi:GTPase HflX, partial [Mycobacterium tuberculosis]
ARVCAASVTPRRIRCTQARRGVTLAAAGAPRLPADQPPGWYCWAPEFSSPEGIHGQCHQVPAHTFQTRT